MPPLPLPTLSTANKHRLIASSPTRHPRGEYNDLNKSFWLVLLNTHRAEFLPLYDWFTILIVLWLLFLAPKAVSELWLLTICRILMYSVLITIHVFWEVLLGGLGSISERSGKYFELPWEVLNSIQNTSGSHVCSYSTVPSSPFIQLQTQLPGTCIRWLGFRSRYM